jgi:hypothetical protein
VATWPGQAALGEARARWEAAGIESYRYEYERSGWSPPGEVWVVHGQVFARRTGDFDSRVDDRFPGAIEEMFDAIESAPSEYYAVLYSRTEYGYPWTIRYLEPGWADQIPQTFTITEFEAVEGLPPWEDEHVTRAVEIERYLEDAMRRVDAIVVGTVVGRVGIDPESDGGRWMVGIDVSDVPYARSDPATGSEVTQPLIVADVRGAPPDPPAWTLVDYIGREVIVFLDHRGWNETQLMVMAWRTDDGLRFPEARRDLNLEVEHLCHLPRSDPSRGESQPRDSERELATLVAWAERFEGWDGGPNQRLPVWQGCRDSGWEPPAADPEFGFTDVAIALVDAGALVTDEGTAPGDPFTVQARVLSMSSRQVRVYEYPTVADRRAEQSTIAMGGWSVNATPVEWIGNPHYWTAGRVIVLYLGDDAEVIDSLTRALGAQKRF